MSHEPHAPAFPFPRRTGVAARSPEGRAQAPRRLQCVSLRLAIPDRRSSSPGRPAHKACDGLLQAIPLEDPRAVSREQPRADPVAPSPRAKACRCGAVPAPASASASAPAPALTRRRRPPSSDARRATTDPPAAPAVPHSARVRAVEPVAHDEPAVEVDERDEPGQERERVRREERDDEHRGRRGERGQAIGRDRL